MSQNAYHLKRGSDLGQNSLPIPPHNVPDMPLVNPSGPRAIRQMGYLNPGVVFLGPSPSLCLASIWTWALVWLIALTPSPGQVATPSTTILYTSPHALSALHRHEGTSAGPLELTARLPPEWRYEAASDSDLDGEERPGPAALRGPRGNPEAREAPHDRGPCVLALPDAASRFYPANGQKSKFASRDNCEVNDVRFVCWPGHLGNVFLSFHRKRCGS